MSFYKHCFDEVNCLLKGCSCKCGLCTKLEDDDIEYAEYLDDEPARKPKTGKDLHKFRHPQDR